jgi:hypothetical protein
MTKLQYIKLLETRGVTELEKGQTLGQVLKETGGEATKVELQKVLDLCTQYYLDKITALEERLVQANKEIQANNRDIAWLRCLEGAGVDNWEGVEYAQEQFEELYPDE